ncbi:hypothetical protein KAH27_10930 [bacterium]|nr:hypothetical protein [bacterium]
MHSTPNIPTPGNQICSESKFKWFCVRTKPKQESIASNSIRELNDVEVFCPIIRFKKSTKRGKIWFQEALFPGYLFVKCDLKPMFKAINYSRGVACLVRFGAHYPNIPENEMNVLREEIGDNEIHVIEHEFAPGEQTRIESGPFKGISAVISRVMPAKERVLVLLELLGGTIEAEVNESALATPKRPTGAGGS